MPTRLCLNKTGRPSKMSKLSTINIKSGENKTRAINEMMMSNIRFKIFNKIF